MDIRLKNNNYIICKKRVEKFKNCLEFGEYKFQYGDADVISASKDEKTIIVFGRFVDSHNYNNTNEQIINDLLGVNNLADLLDKSKKLAGRFILVFNSNEGLFIMPDATATIHVAYTIAQNELYISSNPKLIADENNWSESLISKQVKSCAEQVHPLPYDMSMYDEIKFVIPNHYLDCNERETRRYYPLKKIENISAQEAAQITNKLLFNIVKGYHKNYMLSLPLTAGVDSRTILALCKKNLDQIPIYTFYLENYTSRTPDVTIPKSIITKYKLEYQLLRDLELPEEVIDIYKNELGSSLNQVIARNAWTYYNSNLSKRVFMSGDVIPLAKSNFGKNLPELLATSSYLVTKTHNYSDQNFYQVKRWAADIKPYIKLSGLSKYDMFFWEHRAGKWASNSFMNYDLLVDLINPFNCREVIETWLRVSRKERMKGSIHKNIIELNWQELMDIPINPNNRYKKIRNNSLLYYLASIVKYLIEKNKINNQIK